MSTDLIFSGTLKLGAVDVSAEVTGAFLKTLVTDVAVPATLTQGTTHAGGATKTTLQIDYLSDDSSAAVLFPALWAAVVSASKEVTYTLRFHAGLIGVGNPQYDGSIVVSAADVGGPEEGLSTGSLTCTTTGTPVKTTS